MSSSMKKCDRTEDQWEFLSSVKRMSRAEVANLVDQASAAGRIVGVRLPLDDDDEEPWLAPPSRRKARQPIVGVMPEQVEVVLGNQVYIDRSVLPPALVNRLVRLAAFSKSSNSTPRKLCGYRPLASHA